MFDIGFSELLLVLVIGLVVLGPERLPVAVRTVSGWIRTLRSLAATVQNELAQELKLQELQDSLKKVEQAGLQNLTPELKASMDELKEAAEALKRSYHADAGSEAPHTIHNPLVTEPEAIHDGVTPAEPATQVSASVQVPNILEAEAASAADSVIETAPVTAVKLAVQGKGSAKLIPEQEVGLADVMDKPVIRKQIDTIDSDGTDLSSADQSRIHQPGGDR
ncbi:preprotein translocase subunit TatB [Yersinia similis]|uniref:Sec-independent protein translocase protein TatB n=1 Tax=Yersinia similis TaxID=367190 RepID=A0ABM5PZ65_9GAMM|nr:Sec-independent protein translocase protein TatB [Yersinia similis]AHK19493.1 preprotein translocase subunit TatB [Yersinia similis]CFQ55204.1 Sec-independent protein translocase protein TatB [Yersinia similis]